MKFIRVEGRDICKKCKQPYPDEEMVFIGIQDGGGYVPDMPLFNCTCGTTTVGAFPKEKAKVIKKETDQ